ncbi:MAG: type II secretion system F family protein [Candidatus Eremiobacteraeota bacterium]|nr:type II secretion system F family protein [Candidatus Eremiobacteraeota bacterium]
MVAELAPYAVVLGVIGGVGYFAWRFWNQIVELVAPFAEPYKAMLERAAVKTTGADLAFRILGISVGVWGLFVFAVHPPPWLAILALPGSFALSFYGFGVWVRTRISKRLEKFNNQLEVALRLMTSGLRAGLGLRQAVIVVVSEMPDPIRIEFNRVLTQTSIGVSIYDALDQLNDRMPSQEMLMLTRAIRIQAKTGGNLGKTLETLAETIKQRRKIDRKVKTLTSEARASSWVMTGLPIGVLVFMLAFMPEMRDSLIGTFWGRIMLAASIGLLVLGQVVMTAMARVDV